MADYTAIQGLTLDQKRRLLVEAIQKGREQWTRQFPLSYGQRALWYLNQVAPSSSAYNVSFQASIRSAVEPIIMERALQAVVDRHPTLRTTYEMVGGVPFQIVHRSLKPMF